MLEAAERSGKHANTCLGDDAREAPGGASARDEWRRECGGVAFSRVSQPGAEIFAVT